MAVGRDQDGLNDRQRAFVTAYLTTLNATAAALAAGYSPKTAYSIGAENLKKPQIVAAVEVERARLGVLTGATPERVLLELSRVAFSDMRSFARWGPDGVALLASGQLSDDAAAAVAELAETTTEGSGSLKFKLHDKLAALKALMAHLGMAAPAKVQVTGKDGAELPPVTLQIKVTKTEYDAI